MSEQTQKVYGFIYTITNKINGKMYVGQTVNPLKTRRQTHIASPSNRHIAAAFTLYGIQSFEWEIIDSADSKVELDRLECFYIGLFGTLDRTRGYNFKEGGANGKPISDVCRRISASKTGSRLSEATKQKLSQLKKGLWDGERNPKFGKGHLASGENNGMYGRNHTEDSRKKMSDKLMGRAGLLGADNPMWGKTPKNAKPVYLYQNGNLIGEFNSVASASKAMKCPAYQAQRILKGERKSRLGFTLKLKEKP